MNDYAWQGIYLNDQVLEPYTTDALGRYALVIGVELGFEFADIPGPYIIMISVIVASKFRGGRIVSIKRIDNSKARSHTNSTLPRKPLLDKTKGHAIHSRNAMSMHLFQ